MEPAGQQRNMLKETQNAHSHPLVGAQAVHPDRRHAGVQADASSSSLTRPLLPHAQEHDACSNHCCDEISDLTCAVCLNVPEPVDLAIVKGCEHQYCGALRPCMAP